MFILQDYLTCVEWKGKTRNNLSKTLETFAAVRGVVACIRQATKPKACLQVQYAEGTLGPGYR